MTSRRDHSAPVSPQLRAEAAELPLSGWVALLLFAFDLSYILPDLNGPLRRLSFCRFVANKHTLDSFHLIHLRLGIKNNHFCLTASRVS